MTSMRPVTCLIFILVCLAGVATIGRPLRPRARNMKPTIYDDGKSCPHDCDAHVVFHNSHNGTANAFAPSTTSSSPGKCESGKPCMICFSADPASCMTALYRGGGPSPGRFDFTPSFYEENCSKSELPIAFRKECQSAAPAIARLRNLVNCVATPDDRRCTAIMTVAQQQQTADDVLYNQCKEMGETAFNRNFRDQPARQRSNECAYEKVGTGRNSQGETWTKLLSGACRAGTFVGRDGTDCCNGSLYEAALLGRECRAFFVAK
ncbi:MAG: hypothetical protein JWM21_2923 [Acidobacteria bacterium]|nr:hypothetical protein [Acidobacteriota bacterium]